MADQVEDKAKEEAERRQFKTSAWVLKVLNEDVDVKLDADMLFSDEANSHFTNVVEGIEKKYADGMNLDQKAELLDDLVIFFSNQVDSLAAEVFDSEGTDVTSGAATPSPNSK